MFARACARTIAAAGAALTLTGTASAVTCPTIGETLPAGLYVASTSGELWRVNPRAGTGRADAAYVGTLADDKTGFYPTDIAFNDDGSLYGVDGFDLFCIDPMNGTSVAIGGSQFDPPWQTALTGKTLSLGQLYGAGQEQLVQIAVGSGKGTPTGTDYGPLSCGEETGDLLYDSTNDTLMGTVECFGGGLGDRSVLVKVDPTTGKVISQIGMITDHQGQPRYGVFGLAFGTDGKLYAGSGTTLMRIEPTTGRSLEDFEVLSTTRGKSFDRIDGMASRVCESANSQQGHAGHRRTAGQWRQDCRAGLDPELAAYVDPIVAWVTDGLVDNACEALHQVQAAPMVDQATTTSEPAKAMLADAGRRGSRTDIIVAKRVHDDAEAAHDGLETLCGLGLRELTAAQLNVASGRANAACPHCDLGTTGAYLDQLTTMLHQAIADGDKTACNLVKREAHHISGNVCQDPPGGGDDAGGLTLGGGDAGTSGNGNGHGRH